MLTIQASRDKNVRIILSLNLCKKKIHTSGHKHNKNVKNWLKGTNQTALIVNSLVVKL